MQNYSFEWFPKQKQQTVHFSTDENPMENPSVYIIFVRKGIHYYSLQVLFSTLKKTQTGFELSSHWKAGALARLIINSSCVKKITSQKYCHELLKYVVPCA